MANKKSKIQKLMEAAIRNDRKEQGFFDGRFSTRSFKSKKAYKRNRKHKGQYFD